MNILWQFTYCGVLWVVTLLNVVLHYHSWISTNPWNMVCLTLCPFYLCNVFHAAKFLHNKDKIATSCAIHYFPNCTNSPKKETWKEWHITDFSPGNEEFLCKVELFPSTSLLLILWDKESLLQFPLPDPDWSVIEFNAMFVFLHHLPYICSTAFLLYLSPTK